MSSLTIRSLTGCRFLAFALHGLSGVLGHSNFGVVSRLFRAITRKGELKGRDGLQAAAFEGSKR